MTKQILAFLFCFIRELTLYSPLTNSLTSARELKPYTPLLPYPSPPRANSNPLLPPYIHSSAHLSTFLLDSITPSSLTKCCCSTVSVTRQTLRSQGTPTQTCPTCRLLWRHMCRTQCGAKFHGFQLLLPNV
jgi:hypothetical protein